MPLDGGYTGLEGYWKLDEVSGNRSDSHGSNTLTDNNTVGSASGVIGNAADFEAGNSEYLTIADNPSLSTGDIDFFVQAWIRAESADAAMIVCGKWGSEGTREWVLYYDLNAHRFRLLVSNDGTNFSLVEIEPTAAVAGNTFCLHAWHDAANNEIGIAFNAGTPVTTSHTTGCNNNTSNFTIGRNDDGPSGYFDGLIDEVGFWKRVPTSTERTQLYGSGAGLNYDDFGVAPTGQPTSRRWGGVPFVGGQGMLGKSSTGSGRMWGRARSGLIVPRRLAA